MRARPGDRPLGVAVPLLLALDTLTRFANARYEWWQKTTRPVVAKGTRARSDAVTHMRAVCKEECVVLARSLKHSLKERVALILIVNPGMRPLV